MSNLISVGIIITDMKFKNGKRVCMIEETRDTWFGRKTKLVTQKDLQSNVEMPKFFTKKEAKNYQNEIRKSNQIVNSSYNHM